LTKDTSLDSLLNDFLLITLALEKRVLDDESEPEEWIELLNQRQVIMDCLSKLLSEGITISTTQKQAYLQPVYEVDLKIVPAMDRKKKELESEMANVRRSKAINQQYGGYGKSYSPYGAFFDTKN
jgi:flagellar protein FliT